MKCLICTKWEAVPTGEGRCQECIDRMEDEATPIHIHDWKAFRFTERSHVSYNHCADCGVSAMIDDQVVVS